MTQHNGAVPFKNRLLILGFGGMGKAVLPLIFRHVQLNADQITLVTKEASISDHTIAKEFSVNLQEIKVTQHNYKSLLDTFLGQQDVLLNLSVDIASVDLIKYCQAKGVLYLDTCTEPWKGLYHDAQADLKNRTNYSLREEMRQLKGQPTPSALITHGANPGLVSHFLKEGLRQLAADQAVLFDNPQHPADWAQLAQALGIQAIHIAERDTQDSHNIRQPNEFINTWSVDGLISEAIQPAELGWGTHEKYWPEEAKQHTNGCQSSIYLNRPSASVKVRTWTPTYGPMHGFMITHAEAISIAEFLTLKEGTQLAYRPTVLYAYLPSPKTVLSLHELEGTEWNAPEKKYLLGGDIAEGFDELGVLFMGKKTGAYWFGSTLSIQEARQLAPYNNATSLQVAAGIVAGLVWIIKHPHRGVVEPEQIDFKYILDIAKPYLGKLKGYYTHWTPLEHRNHLFQEKIDEEDPWQFINIRVR